MTKRQKQEIDDFLEEMEQRRKEEEKCKTEVYSTDNVIYAEARFRQPKQIEEEDNLDWLLNTV